MRQLPNVLEINPIDCLVEGSVRPPGSKSITNRALLCASLAAGQSQLTGLLDSDDTRLMGQALLELGVSLRIRWDQGTATIEGCSNRFPRSNADLGVGNSGTTMRFLAAACAASGGHYRLSGSPRMHQRPINDLVDALKQLGDIELSTVAGGVPMLEIVSRGFEGGAIDVRSDRSSQFLSGILMASPLSRGPVSIRVGSDLVSRPYISMTLAVMRQFGCVVETNYEETEFRIAPQCYSPVDYVIEPDASAASYFFAAAAVVGGTVSVLGLGANSIQGDIAFTKLLERMGCRIKIDEAATSVTGPARHGIECTMTDISDTVQTLAIVSLFVDGPTIIRGVEHIRGKESDRICDLATELRRVGADVEERADGLTIYPRPLRPTVIETYEDHRMAMSFSIAGLRLPGISIRDPNCVSKTYPNFFSALDDLVRQSRRAG